VEAGETTDLLVSQRLRGAEIRPPWLTEAAAEYAGGYALAEDEIIDRADELEAISFSIQNRRKDTCARCPSAASSPARRWSR
jgi:hypothetical protein